jgi:hypothetical protein
MCALLVAAAAAHDFKTCGSGDKLGVKTVTVDPDSPIPGKPLEVAFTGTPTQDIVAGDSLTITVKVFGVALGHVDFDLCKDTGLTCPVKAGTASTWKATYDIPSAAPGGVPLTAEFTAQTAAKAQYSCVDVDVVMGKPPALSFAELAMHTQGPSCVHFEDKHDEAHRKCYEACGLGEFKVTGLNATGPCPDDYTQLDSTKTVEACNDGVTNLKYCKGKTLKPVSLRESTKGIKGMCYHKDSGNKCYEGCAMTEFKMTGLSEGGACDHSYSVVEKTFYSMSCSDGKTNTKYCFHPLYLVNVTMKTKGQGMALSAPNDDVTLYKVSGDECGQATLDSKYASYAEKFAGLKEGTCAALGFTKADGTQTLKVPVLGDITISKFAKPSTVAETEWSNKYTNCLHHEDSADNKCYESCSRSTGAFKVKGMDKMGACPVKYGEVDSKKYLKQCSDGITNIKYCSGGSLHKVLLQESVKGVSAADAEVVIPFADYADARANAQCTKDADCPSSYCNNGFCHGCFDKCCETDTDCTKKGLSYCAKDATKMPPYFCHA